MMPLKLASFFAAGFESASHRRCDGPRLDLIESTGHAAHCAQDYRALLDLGIRTVRDGLRWHLIETSPGRYNWSSFLPMLQAAKRAGLQVIWDLFHYGWPDYLDIWDPVFPARFAAFAGAAAALIRDEGVSDPLYCPVNEISFMAWAGGENCYLNPCTRGRGAELKRQLVRAAIAGIDAIRLADPRARIVHPEPSIHVVGHPSQPDDATSAEAYRRTQWEAWDLLSGRMEAQLGGSPHYLDILGLNFYPHNQWYLGGSIIPCGHHEYRALRILLKEVFERYDRPLLIAETGAEGSARPAWLHYVADEVAAAMQAGVEMVGICIYPVTAYPGWDNGRPCDVGLLGFPDNSGIRPVDQPLARELSRQAALFDAVPAYRGQDIRRLQERSADSHTAQRGASAKR